MSLSVEIEEGDSWDIEAKVVYLRGMIEGLKIGFQKWEGTGNDFVIIDGRTEDFFNISDNVVAEICQSEESDGLIVLGKSEVLGVDFKCDYRNADGSRSFCGNGTRAAFAYARKEGWVEDNAVFEACDGLHKVVWNRERNIPSVEFKSVNIPVNSEKFEGDFFLNTGSPHHLHLVDSEIELKEFDVDAFGKSIRNSSFYKVAGTNVSVMCRVDGDESLGLRTYERGVEAETLACGTGAVAGALTDYQINGGKNSRIVNMPGGKLFVEFNKVDKGFENIWLAGAAKEMRRGELNKFWGIIFAISILLGISVFSTPTLSAQWFDNLSDEAEISVITASPGDEIYSGFGHTAIRVHDPQQVPEMDWVFNYGTFSFSPGFYYNFFKGRLDYKLTAAPFHLFYKNYLESGRALYAQKLNLNPEEVKSVAEYLSWNLQAENAVYSYDFFRDNCASRIINVLEASLGEDFETNCVADGRTYRDGLRNYIDGSPWTAFGMDFLLGPASDELMPPCGAAYIPDDLAIALTRMTINGTPLTSASLKSDLIISDGRPWFNGYPEGDLGRRIPLLIIVSIVAILGILRLTSSRLLPFFKNLVNSIATILGVVLVMVWSLTDHTDMWANWNLMWTLPAIVTFLPKRLVFKVKIVKVASIIIASYLLLSFIAIPQFTSIALWCAALSVFLSVCPRFHFNNYFKKRFR